MTSYPHGHSFAQPPRILWNTVLVAFVAAVGVLLLNGPSVQNIILAVALLAVGVGAGVWGARSQRQQFDSALAAAKETALLADLAGVLASIGVCYWFFG